MAPPTVVVVLVTECELEDKKFELDQEVAGHVDYIRLLVGETAARLHVNRFLAQMLLDKLCVVGAGLYGQDGHGHDDLDGGGGDHGPDANVNDDQELEILVGGNVGVLEDTTSRENPAGHGDVGQELVELVLDGGGALLDDHAGQGKLNGDGDRHAARAPVGGERGGHLYPAAVGAEGDEPADKDGQL